MAAILKWQLPHWWSKYFVLSFHILHIKFEIVCSGILSLLQCIYIRSPFNIIQNGRHSKTTQVAEWLRRPLLVWEVGGSNPGRVKPKTWNFSVKIGNLAAARQAPDTRVQC